MKKYFGEQLKTVGPIIKEVLEHLEGKSLYSNYEEGDIVLAFLEQTISDIINPYTDPPNCISFVMVVERDIEKLKKDFKFISMSKNYPILERKVEQKIH